MGTAPLAWLLPNRPPACLARPKSHTLSPCPARRAIIDDHASRIKAVEARAALLSDNVSIPNNPRLPLLLYKGAVDLPRAGAPEVFEALFTANGWPAAWRNGIHDFHHYHSTAHEALGVYVGSATALMGGEGGIEVTVERGDVVIIPAGVGHKCLKRSADLAIVGAYPANTGPDMMMGDPDERPACFGAIAKVVVPALDPLYGAGGPLAEHWR